MGCRPSQKSLSRSRLAPSSSPPGVRCQFALDCGAHLRSTIALPRVCTTAGAGKQGAASMVPQECRRTEGTAAHGHLVRTHGIRGLAPLGSVPATGERLVGLPSRLGRFRAATVTIRGPCRHGRARSSVAPEKSFVGWSSKPAPRCSSRRASERAPKPLPSSGSTSGSCRPPASGSPMPRSSGESGTVRPISNSTCSARSPASPVLQPWTKR